MTQNYKLENEYILSVIDNSGYSEPEDKPLEAPQEKLQFVADCFASEYGWCIARHGELKAMAEWLAGLPSSINIEYRNHAILQLAESWGALPKSTQEKMRGIDEKYLNNWFKFMAMRIISLMNKYEVKRGNKEE